MHKLDIIVTHYNEPDAIVNRFLQSLSNQSFRDFKVTIVDDGLDCPELTFYYGIDTTYPFEIEHLKKEHKTVSAARNYGLDHTSAEYVMFCDCDDMFDNGNPNGLEHAMKRILMNKLCVYRSLIKGETWKKSIGKSLSCLYSDDEDDELVTVSQTSINPSTIHGKIYSRKFISLVGIRFLDDLWMNEDGVFNLLAYNVCMKQHFPLLDDCETFYIWKYNEKSVTRNSRLYPILGYDQFLKSSGYISAQLNSLYGDNIDTKIGIMRDLFQAYYWLHLYSDRFIGKDGFEKCIKDDINELKVFINAFKDFIDWGKLDDLNFELYRNGFMKQLEGTDLSKKMEFREWIEGIQKSSGMI